MFKDLRNPKTSQELNSLLKSLYGNQVSNKDLVDALLDSKKAIISMIEFKAQSMGYIIWFVDEEQIEDDDEKKYTLVVDEIVCALKHRSIELAREIIENIEEIAKKNSCSYIEVTLPSQSFWLVGILRKEGSYDSTSVRVSKELAKKTEFVQIYTKTINEFKPELIEVMVSKNDAFHLEIIEEPKDYKAILEQGFTPEIVSVLFDINIDDIESFVNKIKSITEWQEYNFSLVKLTDY